MYLTMKFHNDHHANDYIFVSFGFYVNVFNSTATYYSEIFSHLLNFSNSVEESAVSVKLFIAKKNKRVSLNLGHVLIKCITSLALIQSPQGFFIFRLPRS